MGLSEVTAELFVYSVGHGDHLLLRIRDGETLFHAVVDCCWHAPDPPPALVQLQAWGVKRLDLLVLTHPHQDHFMGLSGIASYFTSGDRELMRYVDFGLDLRLVADRHYAPGQRAWRALHELHAATLGATPGRAPRYHPLSAPLLSARRLTSSTTLQTLAPLAARWIEEEARLRAGLRLRPNRLSSVLLIRAAWTLLLGGDLEADDWDALLDQADSEGVELRADAVKVGHHGASGGNPPRLWDTVIRAGRATQALISTRGTAKHPTEQTLRTIIDRGGQPACTAYGPVCAPFIAAAARAAALEALGARPRSPSRAAAIASLGAERLGDRRCFGALRVLLSPDGALVEPEVDGARCHTRAAWAQE